MSDAEQQPVPAQQKRSWWSRNWGWATPVGCLLIPLLCCGGGFGSLLLFSTTLIKSSVAYTESLAAVQANAQAQQLLGTPIEAGFFVNGSVNKHLSADVHSSSEDSASVQSSGSAEITYPVSGPDGSGTVRIVAEIHRGEWTFKTLVLTINKTGKSIDLIPQK